MILIQKTLVIVTILSFIGTCIIPVIAQDTGKQSSRENWFYVGGSGPGNYSKIQDAVNNASDNDTIFVYSGLYNDFYPSGQFGYTVCLDKKLRLIGEDKNSTIINGTGTAITVKVNADNVEITGFTIQNGGGYLCGGIRIMDGRVGTIISENIIKDNNAGIFMWSNSNIEIKDNIVSNNGYGINLVDCYLTKIDGNCIWNNTYGLDTLFNTQDVTKNDFRNNTIGVVTEDSESIFAGNNFINNTKQVKMTKGVYLSSIKLYFQTRNIWIGNYWYDWTTKLPRPLIGKGIIFIHLIIHNDLPILLLPFLEIDIIPKQTPYNYSIS
jgi:parallel beta-helix repeat protein